MYKIMPTTTAAQNKSYAELIGNFREIAILSSIEGLMFWDQMTYLPSKASAYRSEQSAYLAGMIHNRRTDARVGDWLNELADSPLAEDLSSDNGCNIYHLKRRYDKLVKIPTDLVEEIARTSGQSHQAWVAARKADNFTEFQPWLEKMLSLRKQQAEAIGYDATPYDALLDEYEPGETTAGVTEVLEGLRKELVPLVAKIVDSKIKAPSEIVCRSFPVDRQENFGKQAAEAIGFRFDSGRLDVTAHPFCGGAGPLDVRLTTRYDEHNIADGFFSILHEAGHGIYEQGLPTEHFGLPTGEAISLGIHESQSRMWENLVGRSHGFWQHSFAKLCKVFPEVTKGVSVDEWYAAVNDSRPSLIRTESDEATYNLHIIIRFELERDLIEGKLAVVDLPDAWNDAYEKMLGIRPPSDADGVLQDVHWSEGMFGYFPTYALGNLYASQLFDQAEKDLGNLEAKFAEGNFCDLLIWLREKVHNVGQRQTARGLIKQISGQELSHEPLMKHLNAKFGALYQLD